MPDPVRPDHLAALAEDDVRALGRMFAGRAHPTPREQQLVHAIDQLERDLRRSRKSKDRLNPATRTKGGHS